MVELITSTAAAKLLGVRPTTVKRWADSGELPCVKTAGGHRRFDRALIERRLRRGGAGGGADTDRWGEWIDALANDGDPHRVQARLFNERAQLGAWHRVAQEMGDLLRELGERWAAGKLYSV